MGSSSGSSVVITTQVHRNPYVDFFARSSAAAGASPEGSASSAVFVPGLDDRDPYSMVVPFGVGAYLELSDLTSSRSQQLRDLLYRIYLGETSFVLDNVPFGYFYSGDALVEGGLYFECDADYLPAKVIMESIHDEKVKHGEAIDRAEFMVRVRQYIQDHIDYINQDISDLGQWSGQAGIEAEEAAFISGELEYIVAVGKAFGIEIDTEKALSQKGYFREELQRIKGAIEQAQKTGDTIVVFVDLKGAVNGYSAEQKEEIVQFFGYLRSGAIEFYYDGIGDAGEDQPEIYAEYRTDFTFSEGDESQVVRGYRIRPAEADRVALDLLLDQLAKALAKEGKIKAAERKFLLEYLKTEGGRVDMALLVKLTGLSGDAARFGGEEMRQAATMRSLTMWYGTQVDGAVAHNVYFVAAGEKAEDILLKTDSHGIEILDAHDPQLIYVRRLLDAAGYEKYDLPTALTQFVNTHPEAVPTRQEGQVGFVATQSTNFIKQQEDNAKLMFVDRVSRKLKSGDEYLDWAKQIWDTLAGVSCREGILRMMFAIVSAVGIDKVDINAVLLLVEALKKAATGPEYAEAYANLTDETIGELFSGGRSIAASYLFGMYEYGIEFLKDETKASTDERAKRSTEDIFQVLNIAFQSYVELSQGKLFDQYYNAGIAGDSRVTGNSLVIDRQLIAALEKAARENLPQSKVSVAHVLRTCPLFVSFEALRDGQGQLLADPAIILLRYLEMQQAALGLDDAFLSSIRDFLQGKKPELSIYEVQVLIAITQNIPKNFDAEALAERVRAGDSLGGGSADGVWQALGRGQVIYDPIIRKYLVDGSSYCNPASVEDLRTAYVEAGGQVYDYEPAEFKSMSDISILKIFLVAKNPAALPDAERIPALQALRENRLMVFGTLGGQEVRGLAETFSERYLARLPIDLQGYVSLSLLLGLLEQGTTLIDDDPTLDAKQKEAARLYFGFVSRLQLSKEEKALLLKIKSTKDGADIRLTREEKDLLEALLIKVAAARAAVGAAGLRSDKQEVDQYYFDYLSRLENGLRNVAQGLAQLTVGLEGKGDGRDKIRLELFAKYLDDKKIVLTSLDDAVLAGFGFAGYTEQEQADIRQGFKVLQEICKGVRAGAFHMEECEKGSWVMSLFHEAAVGLSRLVEVEDIAIINDVPEGYLPTLKKAAFSEGVVAERQWIGEQEAWLREQEELVRTTTEDLQKALENGRTVDLKEIDAAFDMGTLEQLLQDIEKRISDIKGEDQKLREEGQEGTRKKLLLSIYLALQSRLLGLKRNILSLRENTAFFVQVQMVVDFAEGKKRSREGKEYKPFSEEEKSLIAQLYLMGKLTDTEALRQAGLGNYFNESELKRAGILPWKDIFDRDYAKPIEAIEVQLDGISLQLTDLSAFFDSNEFDVATLDYLWQHYRNFFDDTYDFLFRASGKAMRIQDAQGRPITDGEGLYRMIRATLVDADGGKGKWLSLGKDFTDTEETRVAKQAMALIISNLPLNEIRFNYLDSTASVMHFGWGRVNRYVIPFVEMALLRRFPGAEPAFEGARGALAFVFGNYLGGGLLKLVGDAQSDRIQAAPTVEGFEKIGANPSWWRFPGLRDLQAQFSTSRAEQMEGNISYFAQLSFPDYEQSMAADPITSRMTIGPNVFLSGIQQFRQIFGDGKGKSGLLAGPEREAERERVFEAQEKNSLIFEYVKHTAAGYEIDAEEMQRAATAMDALECYMQTAADIAQTAGLPIPTFRLYGPSLTLDYAELDPGVVAAVIGKMESKGVTEATIRYGLLIFASFTLDYSTLKYDILGASRSSSSRFDYRDVYLDPAAAGRDFGARKLEAISVVLPNAPKAGNIGILEEGARDIWVKIGEWLEKRGKEADQIWANILATESGDVLPGLKTFGKALGYEGLNTASVVQASIYSGLSSIVEEYLLAGQYELMALYNDAVDDEDEAALCQFLAGRRFEAANTALKEEEIGFGGFERTGGLRPVQSWKYAARGEIAYALGILPIGLVFMYQAACSDYLILKNGLKLFTLLTPSRPSLIPNAGLIEYGLGSTPVAAFQKGAHWTQKGVLALYKRAGILTQERIDAYNAPKPKMRDSDGWRRAKKAGAVVHDIALMNPEGFVERSRGAKARQRMESTYAAGKAKVSSSMTPQEIDELRAFEEYSERMGKAKGNRQMGRLSHAAEESRKAAGLGLQYESGRVFGPLYTIHNDYFALIEALEGYLKTLSELTDQTTEAKATAAAGEAQAARQKVVDILSRATFQDGTAGTICQTLVVDAQLLGESFGTGTVNLLDESFVSECSRQRAELRGSGWRGVVRVGGKLNPARKVLSSAFGKKIEGIISGRGRSIETATGLMQQSLQRKAFELGSGKAPSPSSPPSSAPVAPSSAPPPAGPPTPPVSSSPSSGVELVSSELTRAGISVSFDRAFTGGILAEQIGELRGSLTERGIRRVVFGEGIEAGHVEAIEEALAANRGRIEQARNSGKPFTVRIDLQGGQVNVRVLIDTPRRPGPSAPTPRPAPAPASSPAGGTTSASPSRSAASPTSSRPATPSAPRTSGGGRGSSGGAPRASAVGVIIGRDGRVWSADELPSVRTAATPEGGTMIFVDEGGPARQAIVDPAEVLPPDWDSLPAANNNLHYTDDSALAARSFTEPVRLNLADSDPAVEARVIREVASRLPIDYMYPTDTALRSTGDGARLAYAEKAVQKLRAAGITEVEIAAETPLLPGFEGEIIHRNNGKGGKIKLGNNNGAARVEVSATVLPVDAGAAKSSRTVSGGAPLSPAAEALRTQYRRMKAASLLRVQRDVAAGNITEPEAQRRRAAIDEAFKFSSEELEAQAKGQAKGKFGHKGMLALLAAIDLVKRAGAGKEIVSLETAGELGAMGAGYGAFVGLEELLVSRGIPRGWAGPAAAAILPALITAYNDRDDLTSGSGYRAQAAGVEVGTEVVNGVVAYGAMVGASAGATALVGAAATITECTLLGSAAGPIGALVGVLVGGATYYILIPLKDDLGITEYVNDLRTKGGLEQPFIDRGIDLNITGEDTIDDKLYLRDPMGALFIAQVLDNFLSQHPTWGIKEIRFEHWSDLTLENLSFILEQSKQLVREGYSNLVIMLEKPAEQAVEVYPGISRPGLVRRCRIEGETTTRSMGASMIMTPTGPLPVGFKVDRHCAGKPEIDLSISEVRQEYLVRFAGQVSLQDVVDLNLDIAWQDLARYPVLRFQLEECAAALGYDAANLPEAVRQMLFDEEMYYVGELNQRAPAYLSSAASVHAPLIRCLFGIYENTLNGVE